MKNFDRIIAPVVVVQYTAVTLVFGTISSILLDSIRLMQFVHLTPPKKDQNEQFYNDKSLSVLM